MADKDSKEEQAAAEALDALTAASEAQQAEAGDEHSVPQVDVQHEIDDLSMVELVPQAADAVAEPQMVVEGERVTNDIDAAPPLDLAQNEAANFADNAVAKAVKDSKVQQAAASHVEEQSKKPKEQSKKPKEQSKKHKTNSGIALPSFAEGSNTGVFGGAGTKTGIPLPPRASAEGKQDQPVAKVSQGDNVQQFPEQEQTVLTKKTAVSKKQPKAAKERTRAEFADTEMDGGHTQVGVAYTQTEVAAEPEEDALAAREFGATLTANILFAYEPLATLNQHPQLFTAITHVKGVWKSSATMDELIVAAAREGQSDQRSNEVKNWYAMRMKKLIVNVIDFVWIARAYETTAEGLLIVEDDQLFIALTGLSSSDFLELCKHGFIQHRQLATLIRQCQLWEEETYNPAEYIFVHLRRERMVA